MIIGSIMGSSSPRRVEPIAAVFTIQLYKVKLFMLIVRKIKDDGNSKVFELKAYYFYFVQLILFFVILGTIFIQKNFYPGEDLPAFIGFPSFVFFFSILGFCFWEFRELFLLRRLSSRNYEVEYYWKVPLLVLIIKIISKKSLSEDYDKEK